MTQQQRNQFYHYLETAAKRGYIPAQEKIGYITPKLFMTLEGNTQLNREEYIKKRKQFIDRKISFLESASQHGSVRALTILSRLNSSQNYGANGLVKSFAFNQMILKLTQDNDLYNQYTSYQQNLQRRLTQEDIDQALALSEEWLGIIKINGKLYLYDG